MRTSTGRVTIISVLLAVLAVAGVAWVLQSARVKDERAAAERRAEALNEEQRAAGKVVRELSLPKSVATPVDEVDGCTSVSISRCWTATTSPEQTVDALRTAVSNARVVSITERPGVAQGPGGVLSKTDYLLIVQAQAGERFALSVWPKKVRDLAEGMGPTQYRGSVIQGLPTQE
jgi:type II secretory pathway pseudopilin PulG